MTLELAQNIMFFRSKAQKLTKENKLQLEKLRLLKEDIEDSKAKLKSAQDNFNNVTEPKLIDFYIYKIQAEQSRFSQLLTEYRNQEKILVYSSSK